MIAADLRILGSELQRASNRIRERLIGSRQLHRAESAGCPEKNVRNENGEASSCQMVGEGAAAIMGIPEALNDRERPIGTVGDLLLAAILEVPMIVERDHAGQVPLYARRPQQPSVRPRTKSD